MNDETTKKERTIREMIARAIESNVLVVGADDADFDGEVVAGRMVRLTIGWDLKMNDSGQWDGWTFEIRPDLTLKGIDRESLYAALRAVADGIEERASRPYREPGRA